jgi:nucleoid-associated protein YgaU
MARLVLGVLAVCVLWWCWQVFSANPAAAGERIPKSEGRDGDAAGRLPIEPAKGKGKSNGNGNGNGQGAPTQGAQPAVEVPTQQDPVERPASVPLRVDFQVLTAATGGQRAAIARALLQQSARAKDVPALLAVLGETNAFLHSPEGHGVARRTLAQALRESPERGVLHVSELLTRCMRGPIGPGDVEAKKLVQEIYQRHKPLVRRVVFNPDRLEGARRHQVRAGESLGGIAKRARREGIRVEAHTLALVNRISNPNLVREGQLLKIPVRPLKAVLEKRSFLMAIYLGDVMIRLYWVGHGADDLTPETTFTVGAKLKHPDWYAPDGNSYQYGHPKNVLGDYFVKFEHASYTGFGAHGTPDEASIGKMASQGCIRMRAADIKEVYEVLPRGCQVEIRATE